MGAGALAPCVRRALSVPVRETGGEDMATSNRLGADLRNHPELQPFLLRNVTFTGKTIGRGSYGSVDEVTIPGAAKKIHDSLSVEDSQWMSKETVDKNRPPYLLLVQCLCTHKQGRRKKMISGVVSAQSVPDFLEGSGL